jgi:hypothetical protein
MSKHAKANEKVPAWLIALALVSTFLVGLVVWAETASADPRHPLAGGLFVTDTTATAYYIGEKKSDTIRLQAICQTANTSVVWSQAQTLTVSPTKVTYTVDYNGVDPITSCRVDLFAVTAGGKIDPLETRPMVIP